MSEISLAFYACFYGSRNNKAFKIPELPSRKYECYYFTNNRMMLEKLEGSGWIKVYDEKPESEDIIESCMLSKRVKVKPEEYKELERYDYLCYMDSKLKKRVNEKFVEEMIRKNMIEKNYALMLRIHPFIRNYVWKEYKESMKQERYRKQGERYLEYIEKQKNRGLSGRTKIHCACGFLIRNMRHDKIREIDRIWYENIEECGIQDQISFFFVKQLYMDNILAFGENPFI
jgi:hypothetical protein